MLQSAMIFSAEACPGGHGNLSGGKDRELSLGRHGDVSSNGHGDLLSAKHGNEFPSCFMPPLRDFDGSERLARRAAK